MCLTRGLCVETRHALRRASPHRLCTLAAFLCPLHPYPLRLQQVDERHQHLEACYTSSMLHLEHVTPRACYTSSMLLLEHVTPRSMLLLEHVDGTEQAQSFKVSAAIPMAQQPPFRSGTKTSCYWIDRVHRQGSTDSRPGVKCPEMKSALITRLKCLSCLKAGGVPRCQAWLRPVNGVGDSVNC
jgi:hypothetical protein